MAQKQLVKAGIGFLTLTTVVIGYGFVNGATSSGPSIRTTQASTQASVKPMNLREDARETVLSDAKPVKDKDVEKSEKQVLFNDPFVKDKWGLDKTAAAKAWEVTQGSKDIIVAVIDTGVDEKHRDLAGNLWVNPGETGKDANGNDKATNGIDDDGNGYIDDVHGWNFVSNNNSLVDNHGHGTHIAGIIGARGGNGFGISGVAPKVSLMILKYYDPKASNSNNLKNTVDAIKYATKMHANIINYSGGGTDYSSEEFAAVKGAQQAGILFVAAAGNERSNSDESGKHYYPADYELPNIISVTAVNKEETKVLASSNYGLRTVDIAAPGENIYSTLPGGGFGLMTGTSQATAFVTGVAALIEAHNRDFDYSEVKKYILRTGDEYPTLLSKTGSAKLLNSYKALVTLDQGVGLSGVIATNTSAMGAKAFSADQNIREPKLNVSAMQTGGDANEPTEAIASFGRDFLKAMGHSRGAAAAQDTAVASDKQKQ
jgi:subtilisin family serine protease